MVSTSHCWDTLNLQGLLHQEKGAIRLQIRYKEHSFVALWRRGRSPATASCNTQIGYVRQPPKVHLLNDCRGDRCIELRCRLESQFVLSCHQRTRKYTEYLYGVRI